MSLDNNKNEDLLWAWLRLSTVISNEKLVSDMPYNEALICNILYRNQLEHPEKRLTATDLCGETRMLKSQMNRTLNSLEQKRMITKERSEQDRRRIWISLDMEKSALYRQQHSKIMGLIDALLERVGTERTDEIIRLFHLIADTAKQVI